MDFDDQPATAAWSQWGLNDPDTISIYDDDDPDRSPQEGDTCRICRGEGTPDEPLFYPCKCSGTIKFVHQACLMEWLVHSQKKYCELCKTPFRFTKLYHPTMPQSLPTSVFLRKAALHVVRHIVTWCRAILVMFMWLVIVPYSMRFVWRVLFWLADGGWARDTYFLALRAAQRNESLANAAPDNGTSPATWNATGAHFLPAILHPVSQTLNMTASEPTIVRLARMLANFYSRKDSEADPAASTDLNSTAAVALALSQTSLLSEVAFLTNLTPYNIINRLAIDILEGQLITLSIVVGFILVFLIREWVVQQQPAMELARDVAIDPERAGGFAGDVEPEIAPVAAAPDLENDDAIPLPPETDQPTPLGLIDPPLEAPERAEPNVRPLSPTPHHNAAEEADTQAESARIRSAARRRRILDVLDSLPQNVQRALIRGDTTEVTQVMRSLSTEERRWVRTQLRLLSNDEKEIFLGGDRIDDDSSDAGADEPVPELAESSVDAVAEVGERRRHFSAASSERSAEVDPAFERIDRWSLSQSPSTTEDLETSPSGSSKGKGRETDETLGTTSRNPSGENGDVQEEAEVSGGPAHAEPSLASSDTEPVETPDDDEPHEAPAPVDDNDGQPDIPQDTRQEQVAARPRNMDASFFDRTLDWLWGDVAPAERPEPAGANDRPDDEQLLNDTDDQGPFVPFQNAEPDLAPADDLGPQQDPEVVAAAAEAGIDVNDADDDAEDLEGILELIGMQGPIIGLLQNAIFSAILVSGTVGLAVWLPYILGKMVLLILGSPPSILLRAPWDIVTGFAEFLLDLFVLVAGICMWLVVRLVCTPLQLVATLRTDSPFLAAMSRSVQGVFDNSSQRLIVAITAVSLSDDSDYLWFSLASRAALRSLQDELKQFILRVIDVVLVVTSTVEATPLTQLPFLVAGSAVLFSQSVAAYLYSTAHSLLASTFKTQQVEGFTRSSLSLVLAADPSLAYWSGWDRGIAIFWGYTSVAVLGAMYLRRGAPFTSSEQGRRIEALIRDFLQQAGGVLKVMVIIGIEMIVFPLYCGLLLDFALLPLFAHASIYSRIQWTVNSPWTSGFVHWFIGTCYMFHFAQFVSMCRKIMRKGVLYFIRDPDDPTFHPVRDVLERNVTTQLRKIAFSALVYGALVVVCLGGVVWSLYYAFDSVLPIYWVSTQSPLEFPLDILIFNFITPIVMKRTRPTDGLQTMYKWWFRRSARALRLSDFLFGEKREEERRSTRRSIFDRFGLRMYLPGVRAPSTATPAGRMVLAPGSDQVRIAKGEPVFREFVPDRTAEGPQGSETAQDWLRRHMQFTPVYIPSHFRLRISLFVASIWIFAAATGVSVTIVPLVFGRQLAAALDPHGARLNDIYAFAMGFYCLGSVVYGAAYIPDLVDRGRAALRSFSPRPLAFLTATRALVARVLACVYIYTALAVVLPLLSALVVEIYLLVPMHALVSPRSRPHSIHLVQDWTLGVLYVRIALRWLLATPRSRPAHALAAVVRRGWLRPDARLATRAFVLPALALFAVLLFGPGVSAAVLARVFREQLEPDAEVLILLSYPIAAAMACHGVMLWALGKAMRRWRARIKDEAYLIGERLHNFGERRPLVSAAQG